MEAVKSNVYTNLDVAGRNVTKNYPHKPRVDHAWIGLKKLGWFFFVTLLE
jgi:hypothetical protein